MHTVFPIHDHQKIQRSHLHMRTQVLTIALSLDPTLGWHSDLNPDWSLTQQKELSVEWKGGGRTSESPASQQRQTVSEHVVSVTSQWTTEERYRWGVEEEPGSPGWGLLQQEMEGAPAKERSTEVRAGSCHPCCAAGRSATDQLEKEEEVKGQGWSRQGIYDQRHWQSLEERW